MDPIALVKVGQTPNDGTGDKLRVASAKINANFSKISDSIDTSKQQALDTLADTQAFAADAETSATQAAASATVLGDAKAA